MASSVTTVFVPPGVLIPLVEKHSCLWDRSADSYKFTMLKVDAWNEICSALDPIFNTLNQKEKSVFVKRVIRRWTHIRDAFLKTVKKERSKGGKKSKPYVHRDQLLFLIKDGSQMDHKSCDEFSNSSLESEPLIELPSLPTKRKTPEILEEYEEKPSHFVDFKFNQDEHPQVSFIKGVLPSLATFDADENLEFQAGVLSLIQNIRKKRQGNTF